MQVRVAVAKVAKWATRISGDTLEMIERPRGGLSFVLVDGQQSGQAAKAISNLVARKAISELAEGVRDGAAARAAHDCLHAYKGGKVSATLNIVSVDLNTRTLVLSRNNPCPTILVDPAGEVVCLDEASRPVGIYARTKPVITEVELQVGYTVVVFTDGVTAAGAHRGVPLEPQAAVRALVDGGADAQAIADGLLARAVALDDGRPRDDVSILVLQILPDEVPDGVRRLLVELPIG